VTQYYIKRPVSGPGSRDLIWGPLSPGSRDRRHGVYRSIRSRQPGLDLGAFQSLQPELHVHINFPVSLSPVVSPTRLRALSPVCLKFPGLLNCWIISGMLVSVSDQRYLYAHLSYELYMKTLFIVDRKLHVDELFAVLRYCLIYFGAIATTHHVTYRTNV